MRKGFTLIELLVVIAIIAILAAILFPVFMKAKHSALASKCLSHGRELGEACLMYMDDHSGRFPAMYNNTALNAMGIGSMPLYDWPYDTLGAVAWGPSNAQLKLVQLKRYVKNESIWICPDPAPYTLRYTNGYQCSWLPRSTDDFVDGDRGFNDEDPDPNNPNCWAGRTLTTVLGLDAQGKTECGSRTLGPSKKIMFMCYGFGIDGRRIIDPGTWQKKVWPSYPHAGGSTFVYADGHAAIKKMGKGWAPIGYTKLDIDASPGSVNE